VLSSFAGQDAAGKTDQAKKKPVPLMAGRMGRGNPLRMPGPSADMMMGMRGSVCQSVLDLALLLLIMTALYSLWAEFKLAVVPEA